MNFEELKKINITHLERKDLGNNLNFNSITDSIAYLHERLLFFEKKNDSLTRNQRAAISAMINDFLTWCNKIKEFNHAANESLETAQHKKNEIIAQICQIEENFNSQILPLVNDIELHDEKIQQTIERLNNEVRQMDDSLKRKINHFDQEFGDRITNADKKITEINDSFNGTRDTTNALIQEAREKSDNLLKLTQDFSAEKLVSKYGDIFEKQARKNFRVAMVSLAIFTLSIIVGIILIVVLFKPIINELKGLNGEKLRLEYIITNIIFRLSILSIIALYIKESLKNFNVNMHLYNLNRHRQNSLLSFSTFIENTNDPNTRNYLIKEISKTIYSVQQSGYLSETKKGLNLNQITDLVKTIKP
jgi:hypothetical protein